MLITGELIGEKCILRNIDENDSNLSYLEWLNDNTVNRFLETRWKKQTIETINDYVETMIVSQNDILLGIELKESRKHIGNIKLGNIDYNNRNADIGYFIGNKDYWGYGIASEAVAIITEYAFNCLHLHSVYAGVIEGNDASRKVLKKNGFELWGTQKEACYINQNFVSHYYYGKVFV